MTTTQRVDVETALAEVIRLADVADQLSGDYHEGNRAEADLEWAAVNFVREHAKHIAALLQQLAEAERARDIYKAADESMQEAHSQALNKLAERDAECERLRHDCQESCDITRDWIAANNALSARATEAESKLAERDAEIERLDTECKDRIRQALENGQAFHAAELDRDEAMLILREVEKETEASEIAEGVHPLNDSLRNRIAAFLAASGGSSED